MPDVHLLGEVDIELAGSEETQLLVRRQYSSTWHTYSSMPTKVKVSSLSVKPSCSSIDLSIETGIQPAIDADLHVNLCGWLRDTLQEIPKQATAPGEVFPSQFEH